MQTNSTKSKKKEIKRKAEEGTVQECDKFYADDGPVFSYDEKMDFLSMICDIDYKVYSKRKGKRSIKYVNLPCAFDIESTSTYYNDDKVGFMYIWMFGINGISIYGRTWEEFLTLMEDIKIVFDLSADVRLPIYVHSLEFEFQFMRKYFKWHEVFSIEQRRPIYATTTDGLEFRCSYMLTGVRLEKVGEDLLKYKCSKLVGDLDYDKIRHFSTEITDEELGYCINDIRVVMCKIMECIEQEGNITKIPLTKTGYVRRDVRRAMMKSKGDTRMVQNLKLTAEEMTMAIDCFQGGFTHANAGWSGSTMYDVVSYDFTSSYPSVMIAEKYPCSNGKKVDPETYEEFMEYLRTKCCMMKIIMYDVKIKDFMGDAPISKSKCIIPSKAQDGRKNEIVVDNGRIRKCFELMTTITEQDFFIYKKFYDFDYEIVTMYVYEKAYLPKPIIEKVLEYYVGKTKLKDVEGKEEEYQWHKGNLNSIFGCMVMAVIRKVIEYTDKWEKPKKPNFEEALEKYNDDKKRFNWFLWGVWITAYARKNLFTGIWECGSDDYIYSDTDSMKILHASDHEAYIAEYNRQTTEKLEACMDHYGLDKEMLAPLTVKGKKKPLGVWDFDGHYKRFKTLGAKRYMVETDDDEIKTTIAGVGKSAGAEHFSKYENPFEEFENGAKIDKSESKKLTHTYIDDEQTVTITDYTGKTETFKVLSGVHLEKTSFKISISDEYMDLIELLQMGERGQSFK